MKFLWMSIFLDLIFFAIIIIGIIFGGEFFTANWIPVSIALFLFFIKDIIIYSHERQYKKNTPYEKYKIKKGIFVRALTGLLAGLHYFFFIGSYSHRKYNTQVYNPRTLECFFGNISVFLILIVYVFIGIGLFKVMSYYFLILMIIPIITNIISIEINKINKKRQNGKKS